MQPIPSMALPVTYSDLTVLTTTYKVVQEHDIKVDVLLPPVSKQEKHPSSSFGMVVLW